ncbi:HNHc domain containing protein [uncultured Caudovirales phage]|uniref:HNHc domain containing protein n=1 Tax=uncultured Caudovirales phage TaxID=2100421 RepID=A0A6J5QCQ2_9CAUD|nr:HNHc domain containing protein [uncultured Caudovirales phage]CAB4169329.1 HNHc domain containing protein [uncultured Caudovirales phage]CAB4175851.1 HNHc domain containing protein [uncultured Caudovirales phage]CAB4181332.1 HNHc domain containing protein [uncultured Caudovirales phage]CAB4191553.1 HNHc domain containing protein [uncultured Caudovirales phage]
MNIVRKRISTKLRVQIFEKEKGICHLCSMKVMVSQEWDVSHEIPLGVGGADEMHNFKVAHRKCHRHHTSTVDIPIIAKIKRIRAKHIGAKTKSRSPMPMGKQSKWKRKMDGTVVKRD